MRGDFAAVRDFLRRAAGRVRRLPAGHRRLAAAAALCLAAAAALVAAAALSPYPELETYRRRSYGTVVADRYGRVLRALPAADGVKREWADLEAVPPGVLRVFLQAEDKRFYGHPGVDPLAVLRSALTNRQAGATVSGASTITMQLARLIIPRPRTAAGKAAEAWDALRLEARLSKAEILELWLNGIPFGSNIEGLPAMARARFGMSVQELDDAAAALLAVVPRRPSLYDPGRNPQAAVAAARALVFRAGLPVDAAALRAAAAVASGEAGAAGEAPLSGASSDRAPFEAPHYVDRVMERLRQGPQTAAAFPARAVRGTVDLELQRYAEGLLASELEGLRDRRVTTGAVLALDNADGAVRIYVGSKSWFDEESGGRIDGVRVENQSGSCLKPFLYALAMERGWSPNDILPDLPTVFGAREAYIPGNFNRRFNGPVRARVALASSLNIPAVYLVERLGVSAFEDFLVSLGFESIRRTKGGHGTGLALGNAEVSLEELTRAFSVFPRGGSVPVLRFLEDEAPASGPALLSPYAAWITADMLSDRPSRFVGFGPAPAMATPFGSMFKTGTANQFQHIWALGATRRYTVGVWMGNFSGETVVGKTGSSIPAKIAAELLAALEASAGDGDAALRGDDSPGGRAPAETVELEICSLSGMEATARCAGTVKERVRSDRVPEPCSWHAAGGTTVYPAEYRIWLAERRRSGTAAAASSGGAVIRRPPPGTLFLRDPSLPEEAQALRLETVGFGADALVSVDGIPMGALDGTGRALLPLVPGRHILRVEDGEGSAAETWYEVRR